MYSFRLCFTYCVAKVYDTLYIRETISYLITNSFSLFLFGLFYSVHFCYTEISLGGGSLFLLLPVLPPTMPDATDEDEEFITYGGLTWAFLVNG